MPPNKEAEQMEPHSQNDANEGIKSAIEKLEAYASARTERLNMEGVWLFVASLGCLGVPDKWLQVFAVIVTFILFALAMKNSSDDRTYPERLKLIEYQIKSELPKGTEQQHARLYELLDLKKKRIAIISQLKAAPKFTISYVFFAATFLRVVLRLLPAWKGF